MKIIYNCQTLELKWTDTEALVHYLNYQAIPLPTRSDNPLLRRLQTGVYLDRFGMFHIQDFVNKTWPLVARQGAKKILSVGSGVAIYELFLAQYLKDAHITLVDRSAWTAEFPMTKERYCSNEHGHYNSWTVTEDAIAASGMDRQGFTLMTPEEEWPQDLDLVVSKGAWCWCFPMDTYWIQLKSSLRVGGQLLLEIPYTNLDYVDRISQELGCEAVELARYHISGYPFANHVKFQTVNSDGYYGAAYLWTRSI